MVTEKNDQGQDEIVYKEYFFSVIFLYSLFVCLSVCLYPINVKTADPIGSKFCVGPYMTPGKFYAVSYVLGFPVDCAKFVYFHIETFALFSTSLH